MVVQNMLTENTGIAMMDSGGESGRAWQRNQGINFANEEESSIFVSVYNNKLEVEFTRSLYHHLVNTLEYNEDMQSRYDSFVEDSEESHYADIYNFVEHLAELGDVILRNDDVNVWNSYNGECNLSQTMQGWSGELESLGETIVILQIHGGADVRGGYTAPKIFTIIDESFYMFADGHISCYCGESWWSDDSYNWYADGDSLDLKDYEVKEVEANYIAKNFAKIYGQDGIILTCGDDVFCPNCGEQLNDDEEEL